MPCKCEWRERHITVSQMQPYPFILGANAKTVKWLGIGETAVAIGERKW